MKDLEKRFRDKFDSIEYMDERNGYEVDASDDVLRFIRSELNRQIEEIEKEVDSVIDGCVANGFGIPNHIKKLKQILSSYKPDTEMIDKLKREYGKAIKRLSRK